MDTRLHLKIREANTLWFWVVSIGLVLVGLALILLPDLDVIKKDTWLSHLSESVGSTLVGVAVISFLWELWAKRKFADELFTIADVSASVKEAGVLDVSQSFNELPWSQLFEESKSLQLFISYGRTWRNNHRIKLINFVRTTGKKIVLYLPDPNDDHTMSDLARRFSMDAEEIKRRVEETVSDFGQICDEAGNKAKTRLNVCYVPGVTPTATYYLFDNAAIITTYPHEKVKKPAPVFLFGKGGNMYKYVEEELDAISRMRASHSPGVSSDVALSDRGKENL